MSDSQPALLPAESEDVFAGLEERVRRAIELIHTLRAEQAQLRFQLEHAFSSREDTQKLTADRDRLRDENERLRRDITQLQEEQREVKARVQKVLGQLDLLST